MGRITLNIPSREQLSDAFRMLGYCRGAEIGVAEGVLSEQLVKFAGCGGKLYLVDAWQHIGGLDDTNNPSAEEQEQRFQWVQSKFTGNKNVEIRRGWSVEMAATFRDMELDWIYLDADHREESVLADLKAWYPKVRVGGMLSGHDYFNSPGWENHHGVKAAVDAFFGCRIVSLTTEFQYEHSWYIIKE